MTIDMNTHIYCTKCIHGEALIKSIIEEDDNLMHKECIGCFPYDPEDSYRFEERPNYVKDNSVIL